MLKGRLSFFGGGDSRLVDDDNSSKRGALLPTLKLETDRQVYRPGDPVVVTIQISNPSNGYSFLMERLSFEMKGIEKLDTQWFATQKPLPGSKQRRGEHVFLDCWSPILVANQIVNAGTSKSYVVRTLLPSIIPPSYKGSNIRYLYYVKSAVTGGWLILENGQSHAETSNDVTDLEVRVPIQIWINQKSSGFPTDEDIVPLTTVQPDIFWKEMDGDADWVRANDFYDGIEEGYDSSRDDISSVSSYNPMKENLYRGFGSSLSLRSSSARSLVRDGSALELHRTSLSSNMALPRLSVAVSDPGADALSIQKSFGTVSPSDQQHFRKPFSADDAAGVSSSPEAGAVESLSDMIGGTLTFFHEEGARRCLEISVTLETSETINRRFVHPSRRNSPTITKVQSDHHEVVADLVQTSFLFSIPMDGPMSFSTPHVSIQWALRFEFFTTPKHVDWTKYEHPLLIEGRERTEWVLPITVHAPPPRSSASSSRSEKLFSLDPLWVQT